MFGWISFASSGPVFITNDGRPAHVLLTIEDYQKLPGSQTSIVDQLAMPGVEGLEGASISKINKLELHLMHLHLMLTIRLTMRTTLDIDDDVLEAAKILARQSDRTAGAVLSELARRALTSSPPPGRTGVGGFVPFDSRGGLVTNEHIDRLREQDVY